jgi:alpha-beta hydrolase superfamily lysophospholipase
MPDLTLDPSDDRVLEARARRAEAILRQARRELQELTADAGVLAIAFHDVLNRIAQIDRVLRRIEDPLHEAPRP